MRQPPSSRSRLWLAMLVAIAVVAIALLAWRTTHEPTPAQKRMPPRITQVVLPPPPPPPPQEPPPEPEPQEMQEATPFEAMDTPPEPSPEPPGDPLTADAAPGSDAFGLQAGEGGGTRIGGKGGTGSPFAGYAAMVQQAVQQYLQRDEKTRKGRYRATVAVWLDADGSIRRLQIISSAGKPELDDAIARALQGRVLPQPPPNDLPQPINLRIGAQAPG